MIIVRTFFFSLLVGVIHTGEFKRNFPIGLGHRQYPDGTIYTGHYKEGGVDSGRGTLVNKHGVLTGNFSVLPNNQLLVVGRLDYTNGSVYEGTWIHGIKNDDEGMFVDVDGTTYVGPWKNDAPVGVHTRTTKNGTEDQVVPTHHIEHVGWQWLKSPNS